MNTKTELTQEEKRIKIAGVCQFVRQRIDGSHYWIFRGQEIRFDPFHDLNATAAMEQAGFEGRFHRPWDSKWDRFKYEDLLESRGPNVPVFSLAFQRAECFGILMGLWP